MNRYTDLMNSENIEAVVGDEDIIQRKILLLYIVLCYKIY